MKPNPEYGQVGIAGSGIDRRGGETARLSRGSEISLGKVVLYGLSILGITASLVWGWSEIQRRNYEAFRLDWITSMAAKLRDPLHNLTVGETFYTEVRVVPAGRDWSERLLMKQEGTPVKIRDSFSLDPERSTVVGSIPQNNTIRNALLTTTTKSGDKWVAFRCLDAEGVTWSVIWEGNQPPPDSICAISADYAVNAASK